MNKPIRKADREAVAAVMHGTGHDAVMAVPFSADQYADRIRSSQIRGWHDMLNNQFVFTIDATGLKGQDKDPEKALRSLFEQVSAWSRSDPAPQR